MLAQNLLHASLICQEQGVIWVGVYNYAGASTIALHYIMALHGGGGGGTWSREVY